MDLDKLVAILLDAHLWFVLGVAFLCGAIGALIHRGSVSGSPGAPPGDGVEPQAGDVPGPRPSPIKDALAGGIAAVAVLYVTDPATGVALVGGSLTAGYAARTVLAGLEARIASAIAQRRAADHRREVLVLRREASDSKRQADIAKRDLESLVNQVAALPDPATVPVLGTDHLAGIKQLARDMRAQLRPHAP